jgi:general secretion pathway protein F
MALWYPLLVLSLAYGLFVWMLWVVIPRFVAAFDSLRLAVIAPLRGLEWLGKSVEYWWPVGPIALAVLLVGWMRSGTSSGFQARLWNGLRLFPWMRSMLADYETANFAELLALLLEHHVPYPKAIVLAAESTGDPRLVRGSRHVAESVTRGEPASVALEAVDRQTFLPMLRWVLATGQAQGSLVRSLHNVAVMYTKRAKFQAEKLYLLLPAVLLIVIGSGATLIYGLCLFVPMVNLLKELSV